MDDKRHWRNVRLETSRDLGMTLLFFAATIALSFGIHLDLVESTLGGDGARFLRRQSEGYAIIFLVPLFWMIFAFGGHPRARSELVAREKTNMAVFTLWFAALITLSIVLALDLDLPNQVVTLKEALAAAVVISLYLAWSRGFLPRNEVWARGGPTVGPAPRLGYYVLVAVVTIVTYTALPERMFGESAAIWLEENSEAFGATVLVPLYFDLFSEKKETGKRLVWYAFLIAVPLIVRADVQPQAFDTFVGWLSQLTEAFIAALGVSIFFDLVAPLRETPPVEEAVSQDQPVTDPAPLG